MATLAVRHLTHGSNPCSTSYASRALEVARSRNIGEDCLSSAGSLGCRRSQPAMITAWLRCSGCAVMDSVTIHNAMRPKVVKPSQPKGFAVTDISTADFVRQSNSPCTRRLLLLRHADSSWADRSIKDHERPLTEQGRQAAAGLASILWSRGLCPELILCSDSVRTRETLEVMQGHFGELRKAELHFLASFYSVSAMDGHTAEHLQKSILDYSTDAMKTIMCMGHNRGWEEAASVLSGTPVELKTANAAVLEATGNSWQDAFEIAGVGGWTLVDVIKPAGCESAL